MPALPTDTRRLRRLALTAGLAASALLAGGCAGLTESGSTALVVSVPHVERLDVSSCKGRPADINRVLSARAESFAQMIDRGSVWYGEGLSMEPLLEPGSWIVTRPQPYDQLQPGMVVLYTPSSGRPVAHALIRRTPEGWLAAGVNNRGVDREFVTSTNLAGVIAAAFTPAN